MFYNRVTKKTLEKFAMRIFATGGGEGEVILVITSLIIICDWNSGVLANLASSLRQFDHDSGRSKDLFLTEDSLVNI